MDRRHFLNTLGLAALGSGLPLGVLAQDDKFQQYLNRQSQGFNQYQSQLEKDFQAYQQAIEEEFNHYQMRVKAIWGDQDIGSATQQVHYSKDLKSRSIIDFEKAELAIEVTDQPDLLAAQKQLIKTLQETAHASTAEMFAQNGLDQAVEKRLKQGTRLTKADKVSKEPVIADVLTGTSSPTVAEVNQALVEATSNAKGSERVNSLGNKVFVLSIPLSAAQINKKAELYRKSVNKYAKKEQLSPALVLAIMHTESAFNPNARSHVPAYGLMQIVPVSAGKDASQRVYGKATLLSPSYLYNSDNNIKMGCAYLHILYYNYLSNIENPESRMYCTIAAYNTGAGNVARAFTGKTNVKTASVSINKMQPTEVYRHLKSRLPYQETRDYMDRVTSRYKGYLA